MQTREQKISEIKERYKTEQHDFVLTQPNLEEYEDWVISFLTSSLTEISDFERSRLKAEVERLRWIKIPRTNGYSRSNNSASAASQEWAERENAFLDKVLPLLD